MNIRDVAKLLESYGFRGLTPLKVDKQVFDFKFVDYRHNFLIQTFGNPAITQNKKIAIFDIPGYGKLGVSPAASVARFIYKGEHLAKEDNDSHLAKLPIPPKLKLLFAKAQISPGSRVKYIEQAMAYFNKEKFANRLPKIKILVSSQPPRGIKIKARAFFVGGSSPYFWFRDNLFNASEDFVNEIIVHEQCHQMVFMDIGRAEEESQGHGPIWKSWMRKVGLDPRRFDPTEDLVYMDPAQRSIEQEELTQKYGRVTPKSAFRNLKKAHTFLGPDQTYFFLYKERLFEGKFTERGSRYEFQGKVPNGKLYRWDLSKWLPDSTFISDTK